MFRPPTDTLIKIFAKGFFSANSGLLIFLCVTLGSSFFFIETAGDINLLSPEDVVFYHFIIVITFITSPLMTLVILFAWLIYAIKSWTYVLGQLSLAQHQFLFYSISAIDKVRQFKSWFWVQVMIFVPIIGYWVFAIAAGIVFNEYVLPFVILLYILILATISALLYSHVVSRLQKGNKPSFLLQLSKRWRKPFFRLFIYHVFDRWKLAYLITKVISLLALIVLLKSFAGMNQDLRAAGVIMLSVITAHSFLIYQEYRFRETQMGFSRNLPYSRARLFLNFVWNFLLLILPECVWLIINVNTIAVPGLLLFGISQALLFRSLLYWRGLSLFKYIQWIFAAYILFSQVIMYGWLWMLLPLNLLVSFIMFYTNYYRQSAAVGT